MDKGGRGVPRPDTGDTISRSFTYQVLTLGQLFTNAPVIKQYNSTPTEQQ